MQECLEAEDIFNTTISTLVGTPFGIQWSQDNQIALITHKGVHTFELIPSPMSLLPQIKFSRSIVYPSNDIPAEALATDINLMLHKMKREEVYTLLLEEAILPKIEGTSAVVPRIISVAWSPQDLLHPSKCILAILTSAGAVELLHRVLSDWYSICELSAWWLNSKMKKDIASRLNECMTNNDRVKVITNSLRQTQACAMTWSKLYTTGETPFAYFVTAYRNSDVVVWRIPRIQGFTAAVQPIISCKTTLNTKARITALQWIAFPNDKKHLLIVGYSDGRIDGLKYDQNDDLGEKLENISVEEYYAHRDRITVSSLEVISHDQTGVTIVASKASFILALFLSEQGILKNTEHLQLSGFTITGMSKISTNRLLVTTQDARMLTAIVDGERLVEHCIVKHNMPQSRVQYLGLACSPNSAMFINVTTPNKLYDHLTLREPSALHIFSIQGDEWNPLRMIVHDKSKRKLSLKYLWDIFELIRMKAVRDTNDPIILPSLIATTTAVSRNLESQSLHDLRISMWLTAITEVSRKRKMMQGNESIVGEISEAQPLIFLHAVCGYLNRLLIRHRSSLSKEQKMSITLLRMYLEVYLAGEEDSEETVASRYARETLKSTVCIDSSELEVCNLCGEAIDELFSWNTTKCPKGHKLPRCALTLLQISSIHYLICPICQRIFHPILNEEYDEPRCLFCDVPILYDSRVIDVNTTKSEFYVKNLSRRKLDDSALTKDQTTESD